MIELRTLGALELRHRGEPGPRANTLQSKRLVLLAYLAAAPANGFRRRDTLLGLFWPELDHEHARGSLRQALHIIRKALGDGAVVTRGESEIGLDPTRVTSDARAMEAHLADGDPVVALSNYRGDFLEGVYVADASPDLEEWISAERLRLRRVAAKAAWAAAERPSGRGETGQYVRRAVLLSGDDEAALRRGIALLDRMGDRAAAAALFEEFAHRVARDLDIELSAETQAAMQAVRDRRGQALPPASSDTAADTGATGPPAPLPSEHTVRSKFMIAGALGGIVTLALLALMGPRPSVADETPAEMVAIAPFRVSEADPSLAWLHEGIVELLTIRLAGEGGIPVADPAAVLRASGGSAIEVASRVGAVRLIEGTVTGTASQVTLSARLSVVPGGQAVARAVVEGSPDSLPQLLDRLAAQLLGLNAEVDGSRVASMTSASLPAIRAYLAGREAFRGGRMEDAVQRFREATLLDSTFALAGLELSRAAGWTKSDGDVGRGARIARSGRDRLSAPDRALLDALTRQWVSAPTMFERWNAVVAAYPARPENWYALGDAHFHWGPLAGEEGSFERAEAAFRRGWALDSAASGASAVGGRLVAEPMVHLVELAHLRGDSVEVVRLANRVLGVDSTSDLARVLMWHRALVTSDSARIAFWDTIESASQGAVTRIRLFTLWSGVGSVDMSRAAAEGTRRVLAHDPGYGSFALAVNALNAGRPGDIPEGTELLGSPPRELLRIRVRAAMASSGDSAGALEAARELARHAEAPLMSGRAGRAQLQDICATGQWRAAHGDYDDAIVASRRIRAARVSGLTGNDSASFVQFVELCPALLDAMRASALRLPDARRRIVVADSLARAFIFEVCCEESVSDANLVLLRLWEAEGDRPRALRAARRRAGGYELGPLYLSSFLREEGRLAALTGDTAGAVRAYQHYLALRPDPELAAQPEVDQVRTALAALELRTR